MSSKKTIEAPEHGITIWLDTYDDIFSDFDPREYKHRALSDDFLGELRKIVREDEDKENEREFHLLIPSGLRNVETEQVISDRLHSYFRKAHQRVNDELRAIRTRGILFMLTGFLFLMIAGYISFIHPKAIGLHFLMITLEPAGWFFVWIGFDNLANTLLRKKPDIDFLSRMTKNKIIFKGL